jgi:predicted transcriptional regulator of viral defense system
MRYQEVDYRVSVLRAAAFHGASHQPAMVFQVVIPKQLRPLELGRHRVEFIYQSLSAFAAVNASDYLGQIKSPMGFAKVADVELTMLDCVRYFHRAGGINTVAQIVKDLAKQSTRSRKVQLRYLANPRMR